MPTEPSSTNVAPAPVASAEPSPVLPDLAMLDRLRSPAYLGGFRDAQGRTLLMRAIVDDDPDLVAFLAPRSALSGPDAFVALGDDKHGRTPLMLAAQLGRTACVTALLRHDPDAQCASHGGASGHPPALDQAVQRGHVDCTALLAPWSRLNERTEHLPLIVAATNANLALVTLLAPLCPVNARGRYSNALEAVADASSKSPERDACFDLLMQQPGIEVKRSGDDGYHLSTYKVLFNAIHNDQVHMVQRLAPFFDMNVLRAYHSGGRWANDSTPLHQAVYWQANGCLDTLLPLSRDALTTKAIGGEYSGKTPVELAIDRAMRTHSLVNQDLARRMADRIIAHGITLGLDVPLPPMLDSNGRPLPPEKARELWPMLHVAQERRELTAALTDNALPAPALPVRPRL